MFSQPTPTALLPTLDIVESTALPTRFEDSSNKLWMLRLAQNERQMLRVRQPDLAVPSPFWPGLEALCGLSPDQQMPGMMQLRNRISELTELDTPEIIQTSAAIGDNPAWVLTSVLTGDIQTNISHEDISKLARHLALMHADERKSWGNPMAQSFFPAEKWHQRMRHATEFLIENYWKGNSAIDRQWQSISKNPEPQIEEKSFTWVLADLRWDQFYWSDNQLFALIDFEAHIIAPKALDFISLEYLLEPLQAQRFVSSYTQAGGEIPILAAVRPAYRFFYFLLGILGESDIEKWMTHPTIFD